MLKKFILLSFLCISALSAEEKIYVDNSELKSSNAAFLIHQGNNQWIEASTVHRDITGLYIYKSYISINASSNYKKSWKCPYCYMYWPIGQKCGNRDCPSKYKS
jgi:hypothetical protein